MTIVYYVETNLTCIIILLIFRALTIKKINQQSSTSIVFNRIIDTSIVFCISDMTAGVFRGSVFLGARTLITISNWIYFEALAVISYLWAVYVSLSTESTRFCGRKKFWLSIPLIVYTVIAITNYATGFLFTINENNLYVRGNGVVCHWIVTWGYFLFATYQTSAAYIKEKNGLRKQQIKPMICFFIAPLVAAIIQMLFYGITSTQVGITISIVMIYTTTLNASVLTDPLTGLNNRRSMENYFDYYLSDHSTQYLTLRMMDINSFKEINDCYGHIVGDHVLKEIANELKCIGQKLQNRVFICRYGGDEFLLAEIGQPQDSSQVQQTIHQAIKELEKKLPCPISVSVGEAYGVCDTVDKLKALIGQADQSMYREKDKQKSQCNSVH